MRKISENAIQPYVRGCHWYDHRRDLHFGPRHNYAYQFFYLHRGTARVVIDDEGYELQSGDLILYGPRQCHTIEVKGEATCATVCFSWSLPSDERAEVGNGTVGIHTPQTLQLCDPPMMLEGLPSLPCRIHLEDRYRPKAARILMELTERYRGRGRSTLRVRARMLDWFALLLSAYRGEQMDAEESVERIMEVLRRRYSQPLNRAEVARIVKMSESHLTTLLRVHRQTNFTEALTAIRLEEALDLLRHTRLQVKEISRRCGFTSPCYFVRRFKQHFGTSPGALR